MPLTHVSLRAGKPAAYKQAIFDSLYRAMRETFNVPEDDQFMTITEHDAAGFRYGASYLGISRSDDLVLIQLTVSNTRSLAQKRIDDDRCLVKHLLAVRRPLRRLRRLLLCLRQHADERELDQARHCDQQQPLRE